MDNPESELELSANNIPEKVIFQSRAKRWEFFLPDYPTVVYVGKNKYWSLNPRQYFLDKRENWIKKTDERHKYCISIPGCLTKGLGKSDSDTWIIQDVYFELVNK